MRRICAVVCGSLGLAFDMSLSLSVSFYSGIVFGSVVVSVSKARSLY